MARSQVWGVERSKCRLHAASRADPRAREAVVSPRGLLSACRGVTDSLLELVNAATRQEADVSTSLESLRQRHAGLADELLSATESRDYLQLFDADCADIASILRAAVLTRSASTTSRDVVAGFGEIRLTRLFSKYYSNVSADPVRWVDARDII